MVPFSPSRTADHLRCPLYAHLKRTWAPTGGVWTPNRLLGTAVGDALSAHYRGGPNAEATEVLRRVIQEGWQPNDTWTPEALVKLAQRGFERAAADGVRESGEVLMVDEPLPSTGRPDLVQRLPMSGGLVVTDTKCSLRGGEDRLSEYFTSHQLFHYAWEFQEVFQEPVTWCRIHYVTLTPRAQTYLHPIQITPQRLAFWLRGAERAWREMATQADPPPPDFTACYGKYGRCEYLDACHVLHLDPDAMPSLYERVSREEH